MTIRSAPWKAHDTIRDRIVEERLHALLRFSGPSRPTCMIDDGRLLQGTKTKHRTPAARRWRTCLRIKRMLHPLRVE